MSDGPKTRAEAEKRRYHVWAGFPNGHAFDPKRCAEEVAMGGRSPLFHQCGRRPGFGPDGLYCRQHDPAAVEQRNQESRKREQEERERERPKWYGRQMLGIIRQIAEGHNDPRSLCADFLKDYDKT